MELEEGKSYLKKLEKVNNAVIKEAKENGDINTMQLIADLDTQNIAIETVLQALENKDNEIHKLKQSNAEKAFRINEQYIPKKKIEDKIEKLYESEHSHYATSKIITMLKGLIEK